MIIADTSGLLAAFNSDEPDHDAVVEALAAVPDEPLVVSPYVIAELDYLVATRLGVDAELAVLDELSSGAYDVAQLGVGDLRKCRAVVEKYADQQIGITDASLVVLAERLDTVRILTLDHRHFSVLRTSNRKKFQILP